MFKFCSIHLDITQRFFASLLFSTLIVFFWKTVDWWTVNTWFMLCVTNSSTTYFNYSSVLCSKINSEVFWLDGAVLLRLWKVGYLSLIFFLVLNISEDVLWLSTKIFSWLCFWTVCFYQDSISDCLSLFLWSFCVSFID